jgi:hypothetical protein
MNHFLIRNEKKITQSQRLKVISSEARRIRELHEAGKISARTAAQMLMELRKNPDTVLEKHTSQRVHSAA